MISCSCSLIFSGTCACGFSIPWIFGKSQGPGGFVDGSHLEAFPSMSPALGGKPPPDLYGSRAIAAGARRHSVSVRVSGSFAEAEDDAVRKKTAPIGC